MRSYQLAADIGEAAREKLSGYDPLLQTLLARRGIADADSARQFLDLDFEKRFDPYGILNMGKAVERILRAMEAGEKICVYSDYDHDGGPGGVILHDYFKKIGYGNFMNYIPHRHLEGYGMNSKAVEKLAAQGVTLIITVDCGIADVAPVDAANTLGVDVIITDHHLPPDPLPRAYAILNSKQAADMYADEMLCGAAVAWKLVCALLAARRGAVPEGWEKWLLDLAGLSTVADMVPLTNENRLLARYGLLVLRKSRRPGIQALCSVAKVKQSSITEDDIGFMLAPRINAASRMGDAMDAFHLLATTDAKEAGALARKLESLNNERKGIGASIVKEARRKIVDRGLENAPVIVIGNPEWRPAMLGLVAGKLSEEFNRPVFLWGRAETSLKGSWRSMDVNVFEMLGHTRETFIEFGGHALAGGFSVDDEKIHHLEEHLLAARAKISDQLEAPKAAVDAALSLDDVSERNLALLDQLAPYGLGNEKPLFVFKNIRPSSLRHFGREANHLELNFDAGQRKIPAIGFFMKEESFPALKGPSIDLVANLERSTFGRIAPRLRIVDIVPGGSV